MQRLEVSGAVQPIYGSLGVKGLNTIYIYIYIYMMFKKSNTFETSNIFCVSLDMFCTTLVTLEYVQETLILQD